MSETMKISRNIDVKKQRDMTLKETFMLCISGVRHRFLRSVLTLAVVALAVAFFMFLLGESMLLRSVGRGIKMEIAEMRFSQQKLTWLFTSATDIVMMRRLSDAQREINADTMKEFASVSGFSDLEIARLAEMADKERLYTDWLHSIPIGKRTILAHKNSGRNAIQFILNDFDGFHDRIKNMTDLRIPGRIEGLDNFLSRYAAYSEQLRRFTTEWNMKTALAANIITNMANPALEGALNTGWIVESGPDELEEWRRTIAALGFNLPADTVAFMKKQLTENNEYSQIFSMLSDGDVRQEWAKEFREVPRSRSTPETKLLNLRDARAKKIMERYFSENVIDHVAEMARQRAMILKLERRLANVVVNDDGGFFGLNGRQLFLVVISFVVCIVGIANAMLMSITERFREIATMKCLGATDRYILTQFMMEAAMHGLFGGLTGVVIGFIIVFIRSIWLFGGYVFSYWPGIDLLVSALVSFCAGILLAVIASIQPSWSASRMAPMEAMRVE